MTPGPVVGPDGTVLAASNGGVLHAIDPITGQERWSVDGGGGYGSDNSTAPLVRGHLILWPGPQNSIIAIEPSDGHILWRRSFATQPLSPVAGPGDSIYVAEEAGILHATTLGPTGLRERWSSDLLGGSGTLGNPALTDTGTVVETRANRIVAVRDDGSHGTVLWHVDISSGTEVSPAVSADGISVFGTNDMTEYGIDPEGRVVWRYPRDSLTYSSPAVSPAGIAYFGDHRGMVEAVDVHSGCLVQQWHVSGEVWTAPAIDAQGDVYVGTKAGHIHGLAPDGSSLFDIDTTAVVDSYPAISGDGTLLIGSSSGDLYAIGPGR